MARAISTRPFSKSVAPRLALGCDRDRADHGERHGLASGRTVSEGKRHAFRHDMLQLPLAQRGTLQCRMIGQRQRRCRSVWISAPHRDVLALADDFKSQGLQGPNDATTGRVDGELHRAATLASAM